MKKYNCSHKAAAIALGITPEDLDKLIESDKQVKMIEHDKEIIKGIYESNLADLEALIESGEEMYQVLKLVNNETAQKACEHWRNCRL